MAANENAKTNKSEGKVALLSCFILFALYFVNVIIGKLNIAYGLNLPHLGNVAEFLLLAVASVSLIIAALKAEAKDKQRIKKGDL
jgi:heme A synthase